MIFSIVVAREGSKGLKSKNLRKINGKFVFEYVIEYSKNLEKLVEGIFTVVSSDSEQIQKYCKENNIPFIKRDPILASDTAKIEDVIYDAYNRIGKSFKYISLLYGNLPVRYTNEFIKAYNFLKSHPDYDAILSMQNVEKYNPAWMFELNESILPKKKLEAYKRQDLKQLMIHDGHTILFRTDHFLKFMESKSKALFMYEAFGEKIKPMLNNRLIVDIDTERDLRLAEAILSFKLGE